jgi:CelD/BcsL family acetyltransferase involved in cellulose biosynthesis
MIKGCEMFEARLVHSKETNEEMKELTIQVFDTCDAVKEQWEMLEKVACCYGFQSFIWISTLLEVFTRDNWVQPAIVLVTDASKTPVMLVPLMVQRKHGIATLQFIDFGLADYNAPLICRDFAASLSNERFSVLWQRIVAEIGAIDAIRLDKIPEHVDSVRNPFLQLACYQQEMSFQAQLVGDFETFTKNRSSSLMANSRAKRRRLAKQGLVQFKIAANSAEIDLFVDTMIKQKSIRNQSIGANDIFQNPAYADFYRIIAHKSGIGGVIHLSALTVDDNVVAVHLGMVFRDRLYWIMPAFDLDRFSSFSPGRLLLLDLLRWACDQKFAIFDFTIGGEKYKLDWAGQTMPVYVHSAAASARGAFHAHSFDAYYRIKGTLRWNYPSVFNVIKSLRVQSRRIKTAIRQ